MNTPEDILCARSEPRDSEDVVLSALLRLAGHLGAWKESRQAVSPIPGLVEQLLQAVEQDAELARLREELPQTLGSGVLLQSVFLRLFPHLARPIAVSYSQTADPGRVTPREQEILMEMAKGRSKKEIAEHLFIAPSTVRKHFNNIYAKLDVDNSPEAVTKAAALGLLTFDLADLVLPMADGKNLYFTHLASMFLGYRVYGEQDAFVDPVKPLAVLGLLLFLTAPLLAHDARWLGQTAQCVANVGVVLEYTPDGRLLRSFDSGDCLRVPYALAFAPRSAAPHGFTPGHLFILNGGGFPDPLNPFRILECTPDGQVVRTFTGGAYLSTRLNGEDMVFASDGRLMACTGDCTDAILEFTHGGACVRRFVNIIPYGGITADERGHVYLAGGGWGKSPVCMFDLQGNLLRTVGSAEGKLRTPPLYGSIAVDQASTLYVANVRDGLIEVYNPQGARVNTIRSEKLHCPERLALSPNGCLYVIEGNVSRTLVEESGRAIHVFEARTGAALCTIPAPPGVSLTVLAFGPNGNLFVGGYRA